MSKLSQKQQNLVASSLDDAISLLDKLIKTGDKAYAEAAIKRLNIIQRQVATFIENPSGGADA